MFRKIASAFLSVLLLYSGCFLRFAAQAEEPDNADEKTALFVTLNQTGKTELIPEDFAPSGIRDVIPFYNAGTSSPVCCALLSDTDIHAITVQLIGSPLVNRVNRITEKEVYDTYSSSCSVLAVISCNKTDIPETLSPSDYDETLFSGIRLLAYYPEKEAALYKFTLTEPCPANRILAKNKLENNSAVLYSAYNELLFAGSGTVLGDVNADGVITAADARLALRYAVQLTGPTEQQFGAADTDGDGTITASDARDILRYSVGL